MLEKLAFSELFRGGGGGHLKSHLGHLRRPFRKYKLNYMACLAIINLQCTSRLRGFDDFVG